MAYLDRAGLKIDRPLADFIEGECLDGSGLTADAFWRGLATIFAELTPENRALLAKRDALQAAIDEWHDASKGKAFDQATYLRFLKEIGYLVDEPAPFSIGTKNVDPEIATMAGPQLVVPARNARFVLNAANARWGSLYDALYGTDALAGAAAPEGYDKARGEQVVAAAQKFLDEVAPLAAGSPCQRRCLCCGRRRPEARSEKSRAICRLSRFAVVAVCDPAQEQWSSHRDGDRPRASDREDAARGRRGCRARGGADDDRRS